MIWEGGDYVYKVVKETWKKFGILIPYQRVWQGNKLVMEEIYEKVGGLFCIGLSVQEVLKKNPSSIVDTCSIVIKLKKKKQNEQVDDNIFFHCFFCYKCLYEWVSIFLIGWRPFYSSRCMSERKMKKLPCCCLCSWWQQLDVFSCFCCYGKWE
jgi:hypothetical protein